MTTTLVHEGLEPVVLGSWSNFFDTQVIADIRRVLDISPDHYKRISGFARYAVKMMRKRVELVNTLHEMFPLHFDTNFFRWVRDGYYVHGVFTLEEMEDLEQFGRYTLKLRNF